MSRLPLAEVIAELRRELEKSIDQAAEKQLRFEVGVIEVELTVEVEAKADGGVRFWVVSIGGSAAQTRTHTIKIPLKPVARDGHPILTGGNTLPT